MRLPKRSEVPENGFYYHHKHDPEGLINNYAYEVIGIGCHTEDACSPQDEHMVIYRPLYNSLLYLGRFFYLRPLGMWAGTVDKNEKTVPRFSKIQNQDVIEELQRIKRQMYGGDEKEPGWSKIMMGL